MKLRTSELAEWGKQMKVNLTEGLLKHAHKVEYLPHYISSIATDVSKTGRSVKIRVFGQAHPDDKNPPMNSPWVYFPRDFFNECVDAQQMANLVLHRMRYYTLKIEGKYDFYALVRKCRPFRATHKEVLFKLGKEWEEKYPNYKEDSFLVQKLRYEIAKRIPDFEGGPAGAAQLLAIARAHERA